MLKKISLILGLLLLSPFKVLAFSDVQEGNTYYVPLQYLQEKGFIQGYKDNTYKPLNNINRAEALTMLSKAIPYGSYSIVERPRITTASAITSTENLEVKPCPFPDIKNGDWFFNVICKAYGLEIIQGYPDGTFHPEENINKVEGLKIALLESGMNIPQTTLGENFDDVEIGDWFSKYTQLAKNQTYYVEDRNGNLNPAETLNRGDFALLIYRIIKNRAENSFFGKASFYGTSLEAANTSSGENYQADLLTAAHKTLPFGTKVKVTNLANGKSVIVKINDRGPYTKSFVLDLSKSAFSTIANLGTGVINVEYQIVP